MKRHDRAVRYVSSLGIIALAVCVTAAPLAVAPPDDASKPVAAAAEPPQKKTRTLGIVLYPRFELLDVYGPAEIFGNVGNRLHTLAVIAFLLQIGVWATTALTATAARLREKKIAAGDPSGIGVISMIGLFGRFFAWAIIFILALDNLGVDITALVAGLGIGGIAVALALQSVLSDAFASVAIMLDRPFEVGDTIHVGDMIGTVEHVGVKTTRLRALTGEEMIFANNDLLSSRVRNYKRMTERRATFAIGVTYQTPIEALEKIGPLIQRIIDSEPKARYDRAHFKTFGPSSLDFEVVYFITTPEYRVYMDTQQRINIEILRQLTALRIDFAYPTQTIYAHQVRAA